MTKSARATISILGIFLGSLTLPSCGTTKPPPAMSGSRWGATRTDVQDLSASLRYCRGRALDQIVEISNDGLALKAGLDFIATCMQEQGWERTDVPLTPTPRLSQGVVR